MSDPIDRQEAIDMFQNLAYDDWNQGLATTWADALSEAARMIRDLPSARPEKKQGEWKPFDLTWGRSVYRCTACGEAMEIPTEMSKPIYRFCPNCGADMRGEENE